MLAHSNRASRTLARRVEARRGAESVWVEALRELGAVDRAVYQAVADTPTPELDAPVRRLSNAANYSRLWLAVGAAIAVLGGRRGRRAALEGAGDRGDLSGGQSRHKTACPAAPPGSHRLRQVCGSPRTDAGIDLLPVRPRRVGVRVRLRGRQAPAGRQVPIRLLASGVAYSRVHTGVHYPGDVVIGSVLGAAAMVAAACDRIPQLQDRECKRA